MAVTIHHAIEREITSIPIEDILSPDGTPHLFPEIKSKSYFDIDFRGNRLVLVAGKYIGLIPINEWVAINVQPKVGVASLIHIISKSGEYLESLHFFERYYKEASVTSPTIFEFFANCLALELRKIEREGIYKQYLRRHDNLSAPFGRINIGRTIDRNWSKGIYYRVCCDYFEFTSNNHYNRMIKFTLWYCLNHLLFIRSSNISLINQLAYFYNYFDSIPFDMKRLFLDPVKEDIQNNKIPVLRSYYENICKICRCIIEDVGIMLSEPGEDIKMLSFIINMENVFEKYLLNILRELNHIIGPNVAILDGNKEGKKHLFKDSRRYEAKPDIIIRKDGSYKLIIDAKYKKSASETDRYQIISHALSYGVKIAILVMPLSGQSPGLIRIGEIGEEFGIEVYEYYLDLDAGDLDEEEFYYANEIGCLCNIY